MFYRPCTKAEERMWSEIEDEFRNLAEDPQNYQPEEQGALTKYVIAMGGSMAVCWKKRETDGRKARHGLMIVRDQQGFDPEVYRETFQEQETLLDDWLAGGDKMNPFNRVLVEGPP